MTASWRTPLHALAEACTRQPLSTPVADDAPAFIARKSLLSRAMRTARRGLQLRLSGQQPTLHARFDPAWTRVLWIHQGMPQIGDALLDLAPRSLLVERGIRVDLFAAPHIAALFEQDAWFGRALHRADDVHAADYDAAIVLSHDRKALVLKRARLAALPWVSLQAFFGGPDFHRARFATQRLADLLGVVLQADAFVRHSTHKLVVTDAAALDAARRCPAGDAITFALGAVWPERTYHHWASLVEALSARGHTRFVLVGAENGRAIADRLIETTRGVEFVDAVGRTTLREAHALLARAAAVVCSDGGLMHLALTTGVPVVALFNRAVDPAWQLPLGFDGVALRSSTAEVDAIDAAIVADAVSRVLKDSPVRAT